jgi:hypothetical protein
MKVGDITLFDDDIMIRVPSSKTDVYRQGQEVFISKSANINVKTYSADYLFRNVIFLKSTGKYIL